MNKSPYTRFHELKPPCWGPSSQHIGLCGMDLTGTIVGLEVYWGAGRPRVPVLISGESGGGGGCGSSEKDSVDICRWIFCLQSIFSSIFLVFSLSCERYREVLSHFGNQVLSFAKTTRFILYYAAHHKASIIDFLLVGVDPQNICFSRGY